MQLLHPIMPHLTEEIWQRLTDALGGEKPPSIMVSKWPGIDRSITEALDAESERNMETIKSIITTIRTIRNEMNVPVNRQAGVVIVPADDETNAVVYDNQPYILDLAKVDRLTIDRKAARPPKSASGISDRSEVFVLLEGLIYFDRERTRLEKEIEHRKKFIQSIEIKLLNHNFLARAPEEVVQQERRKLEDSREELGKLEVNYKSLSLS